MYIPNNSLAIFKIIAPFKNIFDKLRFGTLPDDWYIKRKFKQKLGYQLDLKRPETFNEKIQWLKLNCRISLHTVCADKYLVREYVGNSIGNEYLVPLLFHTTNVYDIRPDYLPDEPFIIKTNHNSGGYFIVKEKEITNWKYVRIMLAQWLNINYYLASKEWQYKNIEPKIIVEKLLRDSKNRLPNDYKLHCFNGKVKYIHVDIDRHANYKRNFYDTYWNLLPFSLKVPNGHDIEKPINLNKMIELAEKLANDFKYLRVDFYEVDGKIFFGELTLHHGSGFELFIPKKWDKILGDDLKL